MELVHILRAVFGLVFVLGLVLLCAYVARRSPLAAGLKLGRGARSALSVSERLVLDARRQVIVVRDGAREHLILLGASSETLIETRPTAATQHADDDEVAGLRLIEPRGRW